MKLILTSRQYRGGLSQLLSTAQLCVPSLCPGPARTSRTVSTYEDSSSNSSNNSNINNISNISSSSSSSSELVFKVIWH